MNLHPLREAGKMPRGSSAQLSQNRSGPRFNGPRFKGPSSKGRSFRDGEACREVSFAATGFSATGLSAAERSRRRPARWAAREKMTWDFPEGPIQNDRFEIVAKVSFKPRKPVPFWLRPAPAWVRWLKFSRCGGAACGRRSGPEQALFSADRGFGPLGGLWAEVAPAAPGRSL
jgi:hypothetical protein